MPRRKHGASRTAPEYRVWSGMKRRCYRPSEPSYTNYGGRGIRISDEWLGEHGFENFIAHVGPQPTSAHEIDRINNDGNYEPGNVRWATRVQQSRNRRTNHMLTAFGKTQTMIEWATESGIDGRTLRHRLETMSAEDALKLGHTPKAPLHIIEHNGLALTVCEWSRRLGVARPTIRYRESRGKNPDGTPRNPIKEVPNQGTGEEPTR
jgi:hypothetical protein